MAVELFLLNTFDKACKKIKKPDEVNKIHESLELFRQQGSVVAHFKYLTEIAEKLKVKGLILGRLTPLVAVKAHGAWRILLREEEKDKGYTVLDIRPHENCYRDWQRKQKTFL